MISCRPFVRWPLFWRRAGSLCLKPVIRPVRRGKTGCPHGPKPPWSPPMTWRCGCGINRSRSQAIMSPLINITPLRIARPRRFRAAACGFAPWPRSKPLPRRQGYGLCGQLAIGRVRRSPVLSARLSYIFNWSRPGCSAPVRRPSPTTRPIGNYTRPASRSHPLPHR